MKKITVILLSLILVFSLAACAGGKDPVETGSAAPSQTGTEEASTPAPATPAPESGSEPEGSKILVAYFSATNNTEGVA